MGATCTMPNCNNDSDLLNQSLDDDEKIYYVATEEITYFEQDDKEGRLPKKTKLKLVVPALRKISESSISRRRTDPSFYKESFHSNIESPDVIKSARSQFSTKKK